MGEHGFSVDNNEYGGGVDSNSAVAVVSSFGYLNQLTESLQKRGTVRVRLFHGLGKRR